VVVMLPHACRWASHQRGQGNAEEQSVQQQHLSRPTAKD
jgi:hypothetical protein